MYGGFCLLRVV